ncbi:MAG: carbohydrate kinase family protein [Bacteroidia bacterium]|nr:carbohydrate kinase family protein [Bacteroidia bacterium]
MSTSTLPSIVCIGASLVDLNFRCNATPQLQTSNPSKLFKSPGGVVRNIAHHLAQLGNKTELISAFGNDLDAGWLKEVCTKAGIGLNHAATFDEGSGTFASILSPEGDLAVGAVAGEINSRLDIPFLAERSSLIKSADLVLADCNLKSDALRWLISFCDTYTIPLIIETVSVPKAQRLQSSLPGNLLLIKPNLEEIEVFGIEKKSSQSIEERISFLHESGVRYVWLSKGDEGSILSDGTKMYSIPAPQVEIKDTTGAGDAATAGWIHAYLQGKDLLTCIRTGHAAAAAILETAGSVRDDFSVELLLRYYSKIY